MAAPLKTRGLEEAKSLLKRVRRQYMMDRINTEDYEFIEGRALEIIKCIENMKEEANGETDSDHETV